MFSQIPSYLSFYAEIEVYIHHLKHVINYLCGMTIICWFLADFDGCKLDGRIVMVLVAGLPPVVVLSISAVIVYK